MDLKIMDILNTIEYGFKDENGENIIDSNPQKWEKDFGSFYYLQSPEELLKSRCGVCWDQVELERKLMEENGFQIKTYFLYIDDGKILPSHTFLTFEKNDKHYWFEHSWEKYRGIFEYPDEEHLLKDIIAKFKLDNSKIKNSKIYLYEYQKPKYHLSCNDFYRYMENQKRVF